MQDLYILWSELPALTKMLIALIGLLGFLLSFPYYSGPAITYGPAVLISLGIFGTFLGIALGLSAFDETAIQESIPNLLNGLKTSFWSSICGIFFAVVIKGLASPRFLVHSAC